MTANQLKHLFTPVRLGHLTLPHRIAMPPMTRYRCGADGTALDFQATYYAQRASAAVMVCESVYTDPTGRIGYRAGGMIDAHQQASWATVARAAHDKGGRIFIQLLHGGRFSHPSLQPDGAATVSASAVMPPPDAVQVKGGTAAPTMPRALERNEIHRIIKSYGRTAALAAEAGFDGVELHGANGYLPSQFLMSNTNLRTDEYGGSIARRARFMLETLEELISVRGSEYVGVKISPNFSHHGELDDTPEETFAWLARELGKLGLAYVHIQRTADFMKPAPYGFDPIALVRANYKGTLMASGQFDRFSAEEAIASGACDIVAFGRRFIANPDLPERFRRGAPENTIDMATLITEGAAGMTDYPTLDEAA